ncbi:MAG: hypothetical protein ABFS56_20980 [Pseudomonadota bacterium]
MARARELKGLKSPRALPVSVQTYLLSQITSCPKGANCVQLSNYGLGLHLKKGPLPLQNIEKLTQNDILSFSLHNQSQKDYYCYMIHIEPNDDIYTIFPGNTESAHLKKGEKREVMVLEQRTDGWRSERSTKVDEWATGQVSIKVGVQDLSWTPNTGSHIFFKASSILN